MTGLMAPFTPSLATSRRRVPSRPVLPPSDMPIREPRIRLPHPSAPPAPRPRLAGEAGRGARRSTEYKASRDSQDSPGTPRTDAGAGADGEPAALLLRVARAQAIAAVGVALLAALLALDNQAWAPWALVLTVLASGGAGCAYILVQRHQTAALAGSALLASHLALLVWAFELDGPRMALLAFVPGLALLTVRMAGRTLAVLATGAALILYLTWIVLRVRAIFLPALLWSHADAARFDALLVAAGCLLAVLALLHLFDERDDARRRAQTHEREAEIVRARYALLLEELTAESEHLERVLAGDGAARRRVSTVPMAEHDAPRSLDDLIAFAASRIETLQRDREDRVRLEGALGRLLHAVELIELGRAPRWPSPTGTSVDAVVAHLRELYPEVGPRAPFTAGGYPFSSSRALPSILAATPTAVILPWRHAYAEHANAEEEEGA